MKHNGIGPIIGSISIVANLILGAALYDAKNKPDNANDWQAIANDWKDVATRWEDNSNKLEKVANEFKNIANDCLMLRPAIKD